MKPEIEPRDVAGHMRNGALLLDVREIDEWNEAHVRGAVLIPLGELPKRLHEIPTGREIICMCRSGRRSEKACSLIEKAPGNVRAVNMTGGILRWIEQGLPVER
ncbi:MAG: rhodanese-like domain-containing protein [Vulcanimicrobiaceae bacterium]